MKDHISVEIKPLSSGMRRMLYTASGLVFIVGIQLFILTEFTDRYFAFKIDSFLTAAFLGAAYWASCVLEFFCARQRLWVNARVAVPAVLIFTILTLLASLLHPENVYFDFDEINPFTLSWLIVYITVPPIMIFLLIRQLRRPGVNPPRQFLLPGWVRILLAVQALVMLGPGLLLYLAPQTIISFWPWTLTNLTGQVIGAWLLGLGIAAVQVIWENDALRVRSAMLSYTTFGLLQFLALARYPSEVKWQSPFAWFYLLFLLSILSVGVYGTVIGFRKQTLAPQDSQFTLPGKVNDLI